MNSVERVQFEIKMARAKKKRQYEIQIKLLRFAYITFAIMGAVLIGMGIMRVSGAEKTELPIAGFVYDMNHISYEEVSVELEEEPQVTCDECDIVSDLVLVSSTAYYDVRGVGYGALGKPLVEDLTVAGKVEWLGMSCAIYECNEDGSVGDFIGYYEFTDTGYGQETGYGESRILEGRTIGTIESGQCIDIYFSTYEQCVQYGRKNVYVKLFDGRG